MSWAFSSEFMRRCKPGALPQAGMERAFGAGAGEEGLGGCLLRGSVAGVAALDGTDEAKPQPIATAPQGQRPGTIPALANGQGLSAIKTLKG
jgi:hypothetical protein